MRVCTARRPISGYTLIELVATVGTVAVMSAMALPGLAHTIDHIRSGGAARHVAGRLLQARVDAVARNADVAVRFTRAGSRYTYAVYVDGNHNGVLTRDVQRGVDPELRRPASLGEMFAGVEFGTMPGLPPVDPATPPPGDDPIRFGPGDSITFTPAGAATPGSLYIRGPRDHQYVVRVLGETGRVRILRFDWRRRQWTPL